MRDVVDLVEVLRDESAERFLRDPTLEMEARPKPLALIEFKVSIVAPEIEMSNERMDRALEVAKHMHQRVLRSVEAIVVTSPALDGFTAKVEAMDE